MRILITRPEEKAEQTASDLIAMGHEVMIAPALTVKAMDFDVPDMAGHDGILFTSGNAVAIFSEALGGAHAAHDVPVFCVGDASAEAARGAGFKDVKSACGDVHDLARMVEQDGRAGGRYLHVRGKHVSQPLHVMLGAKGFAVDLLQVYETAFADEFSTDVMNAIKGGNIDAVMFYSARSAQGFMQVMEAAGLFDSLRSIKALLISRAVLGCVQPEYWNNTYIAETTDQPGMYALLESL
jgi:uroporphyrinogen-III synthase